MNSSSTSPPHTPYYTQEHEKPNADTNLRPLPKIPSESTTAVRHAAFDHAGHEHGQTGTFRECPADKQFRRPTLDLLLNPTDDQPSNKCDVTNKSHLNLQPSAYHTDFAQGNEDTPNSSPSEAIFQELLSIYKLLIPPKSMPETTSMIYECIKCSEQYQHRYLLKRHVENAHLPNPLPPTCVCGRLVCSRDEYLLCFSNHCVDAANGTAMEHMQGWAASDQSHTLEKTIESFISRIKEEFPQLSDMLLDRLARAQLRQFGRVIGNMKEHAQALGHGRCRTGDRCFLKSLPSLIVGASQGKAIINAPSFSSSLAKLPAKLECPYCLQIRVFRTTSQWRDHIHEDMQLFDCTFSGCNGCLNQTQWFRHVSEVHHQADKEWKCKRPGCKFSTYRKENMCLHLVRHTGARLDTDSEHRYIDKNKGPCCFCDFSSRTLKDLRKHLKEHMSHITLILLGPDGELWHDQDTY